MMIKKLFSLTIIVLFLQVVKIASIKFNFSYFQQVSVLVMYLQFYTVLCSALYYIFSRLLFKKLNHFKKTFLSVVTVVSVIAGLEAIVVNYLNHPSDIPTAFQRIFRHYYDKYDLKIIQYDPEQAVYDSGLFYRLKPNSAFQFTNREFDHQFVTNSKGLRDAEKALLAPNIICLGDSYFMGWGVEQSETFSKILEQKTSVPVLNAAISSYGTAREISLLKSLNTKVCSSVIIQYCPNDWYENKIFIENNFKLHISSASLYHLRQKEQQANRLFLPGKHLALISQILVKYAINKIYPIFNLRLDREDQVSEERKQAGDFAAILLHELSAFGNAQIYVTVMDSYERMDNRFLDELSGLLKDPKFQVLSSRVCIVHSEKMFKKSDFYSLDLHARVSAYEKLSTTIRDSIWVRNTHKR